MSEQETIRIRAFRESDVESIARLIHRTIDVCYAGVYPPRAVEFFKRFHSRDGILERSKKGVILVVERNGNAIGTGAVVENEIYGVFVEPAMQGRGYGKAVMRELEARAEAEGHGEVALSVSLPSRAFYESLGYQILEEARIDVGDGQQLDFWKAKKRLGSRRMEIAPCGLDCEACPQKPEHCDGCHAESEHLWCSDCEIRVCCKFDRRLVNCSQCSDFPCRVILDFEADKYVHHTAAVMHLRELRVSGRTA